MSRRAELSILMTCAPSSASISPAKGPAACTEKSATRTPARGPLAPSALILISPTFILSSPAFILSLSKDTSLIQITPALASAVSSCGE